MRILMILSSIAIWGPLIYFLGFLCGLGVKVSGLFLGSITIFLVQVGAFLLA